MFNPGTDNWSALEIMRYLVGTMSYGIHYSGHPVVLEGYSDSNWTSDADELYATSGYVFTLRGGAISWILQIDHFDAVNHGSITYCSGHNHC